MISFSLCVLAVGNILSMSQINQGYYKTSLDKPITRITIQNVTKTIRFEKLHVLCFSLCYIYKMYGDAV